jgi:hypothetical protein
MSPRNAPSGMASSGEADASIRPFLISCRLNVRLVHCARRHDHRWCDGPLRSDHSAALAPDKEVCRRGHEIGGRREAIRRGRSRSAPPVHRSSKSPHSKSRQSQPMGNPLRTAELWDAARHTPTSSPIYLASFMRVLLLEGDDANDQNLHQKGAPFYIALIRSWPASSEWLRATLSKRTSILFRLRCRNTATVIIERQGSSLAQQHFVIGNTCVSPRVRIRRSPKFNAHRVRYEFARHGSLGSAQ